MFNKVSPRVDFPALERNVLQYWKDSKVIERALADRGQAERFIFYEGPPTANGKPHIGHVLPRAMKDLIPRHRAMMGMFVPRQGGWDTHGLPVELEVEKELGISGKPAIEDYGIEPFIEKCKESVFRYRKEWEDLTERIGFWLDLEGAYVTYHQNYIESVWWALKKIWDKGLLYRGHKVVPYCSRCGCALSSHELAQGYADVTDPSIFVRFPLVDEEGTSLLVWTTTPWTLISNAAAAVSADDPYVVAELDGERFILARALSEQVLGPEAKILEELRGRDLVGKRYRPPYSFLPIDRPAHFVVAADYVTLEDGTGIVHIAPAFGEDDMRVGIEHDLPVLQPVDAQGRFVSAVTQFSGQFVKAADPSIIADLEEQGLLFRKETLVHSYPLCWRCDTPLLYYARNAWFIRMTDLRDRLLKNNAQINWYPGHMRDGRFGNFLDNVVDWCLSRERFWGTPLPIWVCDCGYEHCVGSIEELRAMAKQLPETFDLHKPYIDEAVLDCPRCHEDMRRVPEVIDCWFDSGAMPFAQYHYPFENRDLFEKNFPADFICEAIDQTRGWFYSLLAISTLLFDRPPYRNVLVTEHGLDDTGVKMSKHKGNVLDPWAVIDVLGADAVRWHLYVSSPPWYPKRFSIENISELFGQTLGTLWNVYVFFVLYAGIDDYDPGRHQPDPDAFTVLDRWLLSRLESTVRDVSAGLSNYDITGGARALVKWVDDLSNWYVRRSRRRFWGPELDADKIAAYDTLYRALVTTSRLFAPFTPFVAEELHRNLVGTVNPDAEQSVHLTPYPSPDDQAIDSELEVRMEILREYVRLGRAARNRANIRVRQPLSLVTLIGEDADAVTDLIDIMLDELNIKRSTTAESLNQVASCRLKLRFDVAGPRFGKLTPQLGRAIADLAPERAAAGARELEARGQFEVGLGDETVTVQRDSVMVEYVVGDSVLLEGDEQRAVLLDTQITPELLREGLARELVNRIERMRKDAGYDVQDRIRTRLQADGEIAAAISEHQREIAGETLSRELELVTEPLGDDWYHKKFAIDGGEVWIGISRD